MYDWPLIIVLNIGFFGGIWIFAKAIERVYQIFIDNYSDIMKFVNSR